MKASRLPTHRIGPWVPTVLHFILNVSPLGGDRLEYDAHIKSFWGAVTPYVSSLDKRRLRVLVGRHDGQVISDFIKALDALMPPTPYVNPRVAIIEACRQALYP